MRNVFSACCAHEDDTGTGESTQMYYYHNNNNEYFSVPLLIQAQGTWTQSKWQNCKTYYVQIFIAKLTHNLLACFLHAKLPISCLHTNYKVVANMKITTRCWHANCNLLFLSKLQPVVDMQITDVLFVYKLQPVVYKQTTKLFLPANYGLLFTYKLQPSAHAIFVSAVYVNNNSESLTTFCLNAKYHCRSCAKCHFNKLQDAW